MINTDPITGDLIIDYSERLTFGKYKGRTIATISVIDPKYLSWVVNSDNKYKISETWRYCIEHESYKESRKTYTTYMK